MDVRRRSCGRGVCATWVCEGHSDGVVGDCEYELWDLRSTWRSTEIDPELSPISHAIRSSDKFTTSRKPRNFNDPISKFERVVGELHAKLGWGRCFLRFRGVIEAGRHRSWPAISSRDYSEQPSQNKRSEKARPLQAVIKATGRHQGCRPSW